MKFRLLLLAAYIALSSGCAEIPRLEAAHKQQTWESRLDEIGRLGVWEIRGRVSVVAEKENWIATMHWHQVDDAYQITLIAPFGRGTCEISGNTRSGLIETTGNKACTADRLEEWLFGPHELRPEALTYWIKGIPSPEAPVNELLLTDSELLSSMEQHGFRVRVVRYQVVGDTLLPGKIFIGNDAVTLKMVIRNWKI